MKHEFAPSHLDMRAFAQAARQLAGCDPLAHYPRIVEESAGHGQGVLVTWSAGGECRADHLGREQLWLHLQADTSVPLICQRCLDVVDTRLLVDRWFRFVADEETAAAQDDDALEDLLVLQGDFNLRELIEDELVLELPLIPRHDICPTPVLLAPPDTGTADPEAARPNPFAALARLKPGKDGPAK